MISLKVIWKSTRPSTVSGTISKIVAVLVMKHSSLMTSISLCKCEHVMYAVWKRPSNCVWVWARVMYTVASESIAHSRSHRSQLENMISHQRYSSSPRNSKQDTAVTLCSKIKHTAYQCFNLPARSKYYKQWINIQKSNMTFMAAKPRDPADGYSCPFQWLGNHTLAR